MSRPLLNTEISVQDFKDFYWLKEELISFCKTNHLNRTGGKIELEKRIVQFLQAGVAPKPVTKVAKSNSRFDWNHATLSTSTFITDNYKNSENVRQFFTEQIGRQFKFTVDFMKWIKQHPGKNLGDAVIEWKRLAGLKKDKNYKTNIAPQFEYNRYMRAFLKDNPGMSAKDAMKYWKLKRAMRGSNEYNEDDLNLG